MAGSTQYIATVDLGSSGARAVIVAVEDGQPTLLGSGECETSRAVRGGAITSVVEAVAAVQSALAEAEQASGVHVAEVILSVPPLCGSVIDSWGMSAVTGEIRSVDVQAVLSSARAGAIPSGALELHTFVREFVADGERGIESPVGMNGKRLEAQASIVVAQKMAVENFVRCVERAGRKVSRLVYAPVAAAASTLSEDERRTGVCLIDLGANATSISVFIDGALACVRLVNMGQDALTADLARSLRTPRSSAERLKRRHGCALPGADEKHVEVPSLAGAPARMLDRRLVGEVVELRAEELLQLIARELERTGFDVTASYGVVLTGGGALLDGFAGLAEDSLGVPLRVGRAMDIEGDDAVLRNPRWATALGLAVSDRVGGAISQRPARKSFSRLRQWFAEAF